MTYYRTGTELSTHPLYQLILRAYKKSISLSPFYKVEHRLRKAKWFAQGQQRAWPQAALSPKPTLSTTTVLPLSPKDVGFAPSQTTLRHCPSSPQWRLPIMEVLWAQQLCQDFRRSTLATWCEELTHWKRPWCWERLRAGGKGNDREWDVWMASPTGWTWVWVDSGSWWWTGRPGVLQFMGLKRVGHDWVTELNWTELGRGRSGEKKEMYGGWITHKQLGK